MPVRFSVVLLKKESEYPHILAYGISEQKNISCKDHQGCVSPLNQHKGNRRFFLLSNMLILSFISVAEIAKMCISTASPVTQLTTYIARLCVVQQCQPPMSSPVAVTHVRRRWSHLTGQTQKAAAMRPC